MKTSIVFFLISLLFFSSCKNKVVMENYKNITNNKWDYADTKIFTVEISDTVQRYDIYVSLRHGFNFEWRNMWVKIETTFPDGKEYERRVNLILANADGEWQSDCLGDNCDILMPIQANAFFSKKGKYTFKISQDMRVNPLGFVKSFGMKITKSETQKSSQ